MIIEYTDHDFEHWLRYEATWVIAMPGHSNQCPLAQFIHRKQRSLYTHVGGRGKWQGCIGIPNKQIGHLNTNGTLTPRMLRFIALVDQSKERFLDRDAMLDLWRQSAWAE